MAETAAKQAKSPSETETIPVKRAPRRAAVPAILERDLFEDFFDDLGRGLFRWPSLFRRRALPAFPEMPRVASVDVYETDDEVVVEAEMPGIAKDDIEVTVNGSTITLKGEKKQEREVKKEDYYRSERSFGMVSRTIELPAEVKSDQATNEDDRRRPEDPSAEDRRGEVQVREAQGPVAVHRGRRGAAAWRRSTSMEGSTREAERSSASPRRSRPSSDVRFT